MTNLHDMYEWLGETVEGHNWQAIDGEQEILLRMVGMYMMYAYILCVVGTFLGRFIYRSYNSPGKTTTACALDTLFEVPAILQVGPWGRDNGIQSALESAMKETALSDFGTGDTEYTPGVSAIGSEDRFGFIQRYLSTRKNGLQNSGLQYSPLGYLICGNNLHQRMCARLRHIEFMKKHPQIRDIPVENPIFVIGFPRTGTTFLHEMLGLHPQVKMHYTWEQMSYVPMTDVEDAVVQRDDRVKRYDSNVTRFKVLMHLVGDNVQKIHRIGYDEPEECTTPCATELPWAVAELPLMVHGTEEVLPLGCGYAFEYYKEYLQMLAWQSAGDRSSLAGQDTEITACMQNKQNKVKNIGKEKTWMLKCPFHLPYLRELFETFPDATVVWTHRDPVECIASACSLYETLSEMGCESWSVDKKALGAAVLKYTKKSLEMAENAISDINRNLKKGQKSPFIHVRYADNIKRPENVCADILTQARVLHDDTASKEYHRKVVEYIDASRAKRAKEKTLNKNTGVKNATNKKDQPALHVYSLEEYGLSEEQVRREFQPYTDKYDLVA